MIVLSLTKEELDALIESKLRRMVEEIKSVAGHDRQPQKPMSAKEAAAFLNIEMPTLYAKTSVREIPFTKSGKKLLFFREDLEEYLKGKRRSSKSEMMEETKSMIGIANGKGGLNRSS